jgi:predicted transcriptional regulator
MQPRRRDATRVIFEILCLGAGGASRTEMIFKANLSHKLATLYTVFLVKKGLLRVDSDDEQTVFLLTDRGEHLLGLLREVEKELDALYDMSFATKPTNGPSSLAESRWPLR